MSGGFLGPAALEVVAGLGLEVAWKTSVPLALGLLLSTLPGSAASKHARLAVACASVPVVAVATVLTRGQDAAWSHAPAWPLLLWGLGAAVGLVGLGRAWWRFSRLPVTPREDGLEACADVPSPLTAGWLRPRILVPADFDRWPAPERSAALAHERAHIHRHDWPVHIGAWVLGAVLWFQPLMWWAGRRLALLAEVAADDAVLALGHHPATYAEQLLRLGAPAPRVALGLGRSPLGARIRSILADRPRNRARVRTVAASALVVLGCGLATSSLAAWHAPPPQPDCLPGPVDNPWP